MYQCVTPFAMLLLSVTLAFTPQLADGQQTPGTGTIEGRVLERIAAPSFSAKKLFSVQPGQEFLQAGKLSGDGRQQLVLFDRSKREVAVGSVPQGEEGVVFSSWGTIPPSGEVSGLKLGDFNGDGLQDAFLWEADGTLVVGISDGRSLRFSVWAANGAPAQGEMPLIGDVNGDARDDIVVVKASSGELWAALAGGESFAAFARWGVLAASNETTGTPLLADLNADRFADLLLHDRAADKTYAAWNMMQSNGKDGFLPQRLVSSGGHRTPDMKFSWPGFYLGEANGDGVPDIFILVQNLAKWSAHVWGPEAGWMEYTWAVMPGSLTPSRSFSGDFDGDGLTDIAVLVAGDKQWWVALSDGTTGIEQSASSTLPAHIDWAEIFTADIDGDAATEVLLKAEQSADVWVAKPEFGRPAAKVSVRSAGVETATDTAGYFRLGGLAQGPQKLTITPSDDRFITFDTTVAVAPSAITQRNIMLGWNRAKEFAIGPYVCTGYMPNTIQKWGHYNFTQVCPPNYGVIDVDDTSTSYTTGEAAPVSGACCRLPSDDILTDKHVFAAAACPPDYIVTGGHPMNGERLCPEKRGEKCLQEMRCTKINSKRYQLGSPQASTYWGTGFSMLEELFVTHKSEIPAALRNAVGRNGREVWDQDGCIGTPWGSLFVRKEGGTCSGMFFSELQYKGLPGDPPKGTPVEMYPKCSSLSGVFEVYPHCIK